MRKSSRKYGSSAGGHLDGQQFQSKLYFQLQPQAITEAGNFTIDAQQVSKALQAEFAARYLESVGSSPTKAAIEYVKQKLPLDNQIFKTELKKHGASKDQLKVEIKPPAPKMYVPSIASKKGLQDLNLLKQYLQTTMEIETDKSGKVNKDNSQLSFQSVVNRHLEPYASVNYQSQSAKKAVRECLPQLKQGGRASGTDKAHNTSKQHHRAHCDIQQQQGADLQEDTSTCDNAFDNIFHQKEENGHYKNVQKHLNRQLEEKIGQWAAQLSASLQSRTGYNQSIQHKVVSLSPDGTVMAVPSDRLLERDDQGYINEAEIQSEHQIGPYLVDIKQRIAAQLQRKHNEKVTAHNLVSVSDQDHHKYSRSHNSNLISVQNRQKAKNRQQFLQRLQKQQSCLDIEAQVSQQSSLRFDSEKQKTFSVTKILESNKAYFDVSSSSEEFTCTANRQAHREKALELETPFNLTPQQVLIFMSQLEASLRNWWRKHLSKGYQQKDGNLNDNDMQSDKLLDDTLTEICSVQSLKFQITLAKYLYFRYVTTSTMFPEHAKVYLGEHDESMNEWDLKQIIITAGEQDDQMPQKESALDLRVDQTIRKANLQILHQQRASSSRKQQDTLFILLPMYLLVTHALQEKILLGYFPKWCSGDEGQSALVNIENEIKYLFDTHGLYRCIPQISSTPNAIRMNLNAQRKTHLPVRGYSYKVSTTVREALQVRSSSSPHLKRLLQGDKQSKTMTDKATQDQKQENKQCFNYNDVVNTINQSSIKLAHNQISTDKSRTSWINKLMPG